MAVRRRTVTPAECDRHRPRPRPGRLPFPRQVATNIRWAVLYNALALPLAAGALLPAFGWTLSPSAAGAMMALSSVSVVANSVRLRREMLAARQQFYPPPP